MAALIVEFKLDKLASRIKKIQDRITEEVQKTMHKIGQKLVSDIVGGAARNFSAAWSSSGYDLDGATGSLMNGVRDALVVGPRIVGFSERIMDQATLTEGGGGLGYWRLFEYGGATKSYPRARSRAGGSDEFHFVPGGGGKTGEGEMFKGGSHPGVMPTRMFQDTFLMNKKYMREQLRNAVKRAVKGK